MTPGIYSMPFSQYEAVDAASKHGLDALAVSPLHHWQWYRNPDRRPPKDTPAKLLGSAIHTAILEPERFEGEYIQEPEPKDFKDTLVTLDDYKTAAKELKVPVSGTKAELEARLTAAGRPVKDFWNVRYAEVVGNRSCLSETDYRRVVGIRNRVRKHPAASELLKYGKAEQSIFWTDPDTGVACKGRLDWLAPKSPEGVMVVDLKSTTDASPEGFQRSITKYRYYVQAAMYLDGLFHIGYDPDVFIFAAWEKQSPYASALYYASEGMIEQGRQEYKRLLKIYAKCLERGEWPGYSNEINEIDLPENFKAGSSLSELETESDWLSEMTEG